MAPVQDVPRCSLLIPPTPPINTLTGVRLASASDLSNSKVLARRHGGKPAAVSAATQLCYQPHTRRVPPPGARRGQLRPARHFSWTSAIGMRGEWWSSGYRDKGAVNKARSARPVRGRCRSVAIHSPPQDAGISARLPPQRRPETRSMSSHAPVTCRPGTCFALTFASCERYGVTHTLREIQREKHPSIYSQADPAPSALRAETLAAKSASSQRTGLRAHSSPRRWTGVLQTDRSRHASRTARVPHGAG